MIPGPLYIYKCPHCENLIARKTLRTGNTFDSTLYSDGRRIAPNLPEFPDITKCSKCNTIFWFNKLKSIGKIDFGDDDVSEWDDAEIAEFLSIEDYFRALETGLAENIQEEFYVRHELLCTFNDIHRKGDEPHQDITDARFVSNNEALMKLLNPDNTFRQILLAELYRYQGRFDDCMKILAEIKEEDLDWLIDAFKSECAKGNTLVFKFVNT